MHNAERLKELQFLPLERKIQITQTRIIEWYQHYDGNVCVSFSGGKDSTVLLHIARQIYPSIPAVFSNTGLEYPEIQKFVKSFDNVDIVTPSMNFAQVISTYGYPLIGKEVAEAIYYARRIRPAEREREREQTTRRKQTELLCNRTSYQRVTPQTDGQPCKGDGVATRLETAGNRGGQNRRRAEISGSLTTGENLNRQRRAGIVGTPMNHGRETDGSYQGSEVPPG